MFVLPFLPFILTIFALSPHLRSPLCSPEREYNTNGLRKENRQTHVHLPATFFATCSLHSSIKQWTDFPWRYISYQKNLPSRLPNDLFRVSICIFSPGSGKAVFISLLCYPSIFIILSLRLCYCYCFALPYPGFLRMSL